MKNYLLILLSLFLASCDNDNDNKKPLDVTNIHLTDAGQVPFEFKFEAIPEGNYIQKCIVRTLNVKKNDTLQSVTAFTQNDKLLINIVSAPYDFYCNDDSCFTVHDVSFNLAGLEKREYKVDIGVNNTHGRIISYQMK